MHFISIIDQRAIDARNELNATADRLEPQLQSIMSDYLGKKVFKLSGYGGLMAGISGRIKREIELPERYQLLFDSPVGWITAELSYRYDLAAGGVNYIREDFRIARRDDHGVMTETDSLAYPAGRPQFTLAQVKDVKDRIYEIETKSRELRRSIACFSR